jgi:hypothetical protein
MKKLVLIFLLLSSCGNTLPTYKVGDCFENTDKDTYSKITSLIDKGSFIIVEYSFASYTVISMDFNQDSKNRELESFKIVYPNNVDCSLYDKTKIAIDILRINYRLDTLNLRLDNLDK